MNKISRINIFRRLIAGALFCGLMLITYAQDQADLVTDRPDQTESAEVVPKYTLQIETGVFHEWEDKSEDGYIINADYGGTLLRFGFHRILEARLGTGILQTRDKLPGMEPVEQHGMAPLVLGMKAKILNENGFIPDLALIASYQIPKTGHEDFSSETLIQTYIASFAHTLTGNLGLGYNLGLVHGPGSTTNTLIYSLVMGFSAGDKLGIFLETYGSKIWMGGSQHVFVPLDTRVDAGITYLVRPNLQLDLSAGKGLSINAPKGFISTGVSWRIPR
jgi:hypothetical protein